jgi:hypothetical protein
MDRLVKTVELTCTEGATKDGWVVLQAKSPDQPDAALAFRVSH